MRRSTLQLTVALLFASLLSAVGARAEPLDLDDPTARSILVRFENSPRNRPDSLDRGYGPMLPARAESVGHGLLQVVIAGELVEQYLFGTAQPEPGSFGDFVWVFEARTGDVLDARFEGHLTQTLDWGLVRSTTRARVQVRMSTRERAGFRPPREVLGTRLFRYCEPTVDVDADCRGVRAVRFDRDRGYVNAVGVIEVEAALGIEVDSFSPLGEAVFLEMSTDLPADVEAVAGASRVTSPVHTERR